VTAPPEDVIYGRHPVLEALEAGESLSRVLVAEGALPQGTLAKVLAAARAAGVPVKHVPRAALERALSGEARAHHQGVLAYVSSFTYTDLAEILASAIRRAEPPLVLVLDSVQDVHNLGSLLRSAEAAGAHGVVLGDRHGAGVTAAVRKASAGAVAHLAVARADLATALDDLAAHGLRVVGLLAEGEVAYDRADLAGPLALVVGGEDRGLSAAVARRCQVVVCLPMAGHVGSLNAAVAGSIVLYEALRQRRSGASGPPQGGPEL
jgi:23S rRNA (guanosine2251-2'-O)-methyltransferase